MEQVLFSQIGMPEFKELIRCTIREAIKEGIPSQAQTQDERLTRRQICELYKISFPTLHKAMHDGLPFEKIFRKTVFRRQEVDQFFKNKKGGLK